MRQCLARQRRLYRLSALLHCSSTMGDGFRVCYCVMDLPLLFLIVVKGHRFRGNRLVGVSASSEPFVLHICMRIMLQGYQGCSLWLHTLAVPSLYIFLALLEQLM